jgi:hypothetical protein
MKYIIVPMLMATIFVSGCATQITPEISIVEWKGQMNIVDDQYRSAGSSDAVLGSYGRKSSSGVNRYQMDGLYIEEFELRKPRVVIVTFDNVSKMDKLGFKLSEEAKVNLKIQSENKGSYRVVVVKPKDPSVFEKAIRALYGDDEFLIGKARNVNFRYIDSVVYIVNYDGTNKVDWSFVGNANMDRVAEGFNVDIDLGQNNSTTIGLPDDQVIAYQYRRLCWDEGEIVDAVRDLIGSDANACGQGYYEYPGK